MRFPRRTRDASEPTPFESSEKRILWYLVTPGYSPASGGAATYMRLLAESLSKDGVDVVVATESYPGTPRRGRSSDGGTGSIVIDRLFPLRAGRAELDWRSYAAYVRQNVLMLRLPSNLADAIRETGATSVVVLVHSSFFYKPSLMPVVLERMRRQLPSSTRLILDVRDPLFDRSLAPVFSRFDAAIGCSRSIVNRLRSMLPEKMEVAHIPMPFEPEIPPSADEVDSALAAYGLAGIPYVLNPNGISDAKRYPDILNAVKALRRIPGYGDTLLVTIGRSRDWTRRDETAVCEGVLKYLGNVPHRDALALMKGSQATVILSLVESPSRSAVEALALGTPIIAPPVEEFLNCIPTSVVKSEIPEEVAHQIVRVIERPAEETYPLQAHSMTALLPLYRALEPN